LSDTLQNEKDAVFQELRQSIGAQDSERIRALAAENPEWTRQCLSDPKKVALYWNTQGRETALIPEMPQHASRLDKNPETTKINGVKNREKWREMMDALMAAGLPLRDARRKWAHDALQHASDTATLDWMVSQGVFSDEGLGGLAWARSGGWHCQGLLATLSEEGPAENAVLDRLLVVGVAGGERPLFGITELVCAGLWTLAEHLAARGEKPGRDLESQCNITHRSGPIETFMAVFSPAGSPGPMARDDAQEAVSRLRQLVKWGAVIDPASGESSAALAALLEHSGGKTKRPMTPEYLGTVGSELISLGADPNGGPFLARRLATLSCQERERKGEKALISASAAFRWAVENGFDMSAHAGEVHAIAAKIQDPAEAWRMAERFEALGARISSIEARGPSPVKEALESLRMDLAWKFIHAGAPADYISQYFGETALHFLAEKATKACLAQLALLLARPEMKAIAGQASTSSMRMGAQPLHLACAALNEKAIQLLLDAGAEVNAQDTKGWTPLRHLLRKTGPKTQEKTAALARLLIERGADPSISDQNGLTPAQGMAKKAPLAALAQILALRPEDAAGEDAASAQANKTLRQRGGEGVSVAEQAELSQVMAQAKSKHKTRKETPLSANDPLQGQEDDQGDANVSASIRHARSL